MSLESYYPRNGLWNWMTGASPTPLGENRWSTREDAASFCGRQNDYVATFGITCEVVTEYSSDYPVYPWRVLCHSR